MQTKKLIATVRQGSDRYGNQLEKSGKHGDGGNSTIVRGWNFWWILWFGTSWWFFFTSGETYRNTNFIPNLHEKARPRLASEVGAVAYGSWLLPMRNLPHTHIFYRMDEFTCVVFAIVIVQNHDGKSELWPIFYTYIFSVGSFSLAESDSSKIEDHKSYPLTLTLPSFTHHHNL